MKAGQTELEFLAARLRARVAEGRYADARVAFQEYCQALRKTAANLPPRDPGLRRLEDDWHLLLDEMRRRVRAGRAHAGARLARLPRRHPVYSEPSLSRHTWDVSG